MRGLGIISLVAGALAGCTDPCNKGTVYVVYTLIGGVERADNIDVTIDDAADGMQTQNISRRASDSSIEVQFTTYPTGKKLALTLTAFQGKTELATATQTTTASLTCTTLSFLLDGTILDLGVTLNDLTADDAFSSLDIPCSTYNASGGAGNPCSVSATVTFDKGGGVAQNCPCNGGRECTSGGALVTGTNTGTCCINRRPVCGNPSCGTTVTDSCTGVVTTCTGCGGGKFCSGGTCVAFAGCPSTSPAPGATCSNGPAFDRGDGNFLTCECPGGYNCFTVPPS